MDAIMLSVVNMSLTASIVILGVCIARLLLKRAPKIIAYILWIVVAFRLIVPFSFESDFSFLPTKADPIPQDIVYQEVPRIDTGITGVDDFVSDMLPSQVPIMNDNYVPGDIDDTNTTTSNPLQTYFSIGALIWIIGIICMLVYSLVSIYLLKRRVQEAVHLQENIYETSNIKTPFVIGFIRPKIYLPSGLDAKEKEYIILHEQTHISRFDHIVKLIAFFILCVHWFNPLVWVAFILMTADMELSCDEKVLQKLGDGIKKDYSYSLLSLSTGRSIINGSPLAFGEGGIKARIKNILKFKKSSRIVLIAGVVVAAVLIVGFAANRATGGSPDYLYNLYQNAANEVNYSNSRSYERNRLSTSEAGIMDTEATEHYEVNWALSKDYRYFRKSEYTMFGETSSTNTYYIDGICYATNEGIVDGEIKADKVALNDDPINWNPLTIISIEKDAFKNATVLQVDDNTHLQVTVDGQSAAKHFFGIYSNGMKFNDATVTTMIDKDGHIIDQHINWSYMNYPVESDELATFSISEAIYNISVADFEIDFPDDLDSYEVIDIQGPMSGEYSLITALQNTDYDASLTIAALQDYIKNEINRNYSQGIVLNRILNTYISEDGSLYILIQLPQQPGSGVQSNDDGWLRVIEVERNNEEYKATTRTLGAKISMYDGPYAQMCIPIIDNELWFAITYVSDYEYKVFFNGEQLALNVEGMVAVVIASDTEPTAERLPVVTKSDTLPVYEKNESGQTYGNGNQVQELGYYPDLLLVEGQDGTVGYVYHTDLMGEIPANPEEALRLQEENYGVDRMIPIYESDGKTRISSFFIPGLKREGTY